LGLRLQITRTTPRRRMTLQCSQIGLTLERTFTDRLSEIGVEISATELAI
jgi:hypothetical protein